MKDAKYISANVDLAILFSRSDKSDINLEKFSFNRLFL